MNNIGKKIKITALFVGVLIAVAGIVLFAVFAVSETNDLETAFLHSLGIIGVFVLAWIVFIVMSGIGQIVENSDLMTVIMLEKYQEENGEE